MLGIGNELSNGANPLTFLWDGATTDFACQRLLNLFVLDGFILDWADDSRVCHRISFDYLSMGKR